MSFFGGGSDSSNNKIIKEQKKEADRFKRDTREQKARIKSGTQRINSIFDLDDGTYQTPGEYKKVKGKQKWNWRDGEEQAQSGLGDDFYTGFTDSLTDVYMPELEHQRQDASSANRFNMARSGLGRSSVAADTAGDLFREGETAKTRIQSDIDNQLAGLKGDINAAKRASLGTLYSTEDPKAAASAALSEATAIQSRAPQFSDLGQIFSSAAMGYGNYRDQQNARRYAAAIPTRNPYTGSGQNYG